MRYESLHQKAKLAPYGVVRATWGVFWFGLRPGIHPSDFGRRANEGVSRGVCRLRQRRVAVDAETSARVGRYCIERQPKASCQAINPAAWRTTR